MRIKNFEDYIKSEQEMAMHFGNTWEEGTEYMFERACRKYTTRPKSDLIILVAIADETEFCKFKYEFCKEAIKAGYKDNMICEVRLSGSQTMYMTRMPRGKKWISIKPKASMKNLWIRSKVLFSWNGQRNYIPEA